MSSKPASESKLPELMKGDVEKVGVFIDVGYLSRISEHLLTEFGRRVAPPLYSKWNIDYGKLALKMAGSYDLAYRRCYTCPPYEEDTKDENIKAQQRLRRKRYVNFKNIVKEKCGFELIEGHLTQHIKAWPGEEEGTIVVKKGYKQKGVDVRIAVDITSLVCTEKIDHVCLLTGDGDFVPVVRFARNRGVHTTLWHGGDSRSCRPSNMLVDECRNNQSLMDIIDEIVYSQSTQR